MPNFTSKQTQNIFLNGQFLSGVQSASILYDTNAEISTYINDTGFNYFTNNQNYANLDIEYIPSNSDFVLNFTGLMPVSGRVNYGNKYLNFNSGYLLNYGIRSSIDNPIVSRANFRIFGKFAEETGIISVPPINYNINPYSLTYTDITFNEALTNRLSSFEIVIESNRTPQYNIGEYYPTEVLLNFPIKIDFSLQLEIDEYSMSNMKSFLLTQDLRSVRINFKNYSDNQNIMSLIFNNIANASQSMNLNVTDNGNANLSFSTYILS
jgi:hypothetical protein